MRILSLWVFFVVSSVLLLLLPTGITGSNGKSVGTGQFYNLPKFSEYQLEELEAQLAWLNRNSVKPPLLSQLVGKMKTGKRRPTQPVLLPPPRIGKKLDQTLMNFLNEDYTEEQKEIK